VQDDEIFFRDGPPSPQSRPTSPGPDLDIDSELDPQPQPPAPEAARRRAVAHVRPISIPDIVRDVYGADPMRVIRDVDRIYLPEGGLLCTVWLLVNQATPDALNESARQRTLHVHTAKCLPC